jgi:5-methylthioadenosine/S-adenosylhomocysteine deaminase
MATRLGAQALHLGDVTGSLEPGKRADLIVLRLATLHNTPAFTRDPNALYSQIVYAAKGTDVSDVMCNGRWLMRGGELLTIDTRTLTAAAQEYARRIDAFLIQREESVLKKLVAIGGAVEEESFEVQVKARLPSPDALLAALESTSVTVIRSVRYHQFDTYFFFDEPDQGRLRYREDEFLDEKGEVVRVRARLTLTGESRERAFGSVLLFRSRYLAPATHSLRFYREYFKPRQERHVEKMRRRWLVAYRGIEFYVHLDQLLDPASPDWFLEVKSRTWSRRDAEDKAATITALLGELGASPDNMIADGYVDFDSWRSGHPARQSDTVLPK